MMTSLRSLFYCLALKDCVARLLRVWGLLFLFLKIKPSYCGIGATIAQPARPSPFPIMRNCCAYISTVWHDTTVCDGMNNRSFKKKKKRKKSKLIGTRLYIPLFLALLILFTDLFIYFLLTMKRFCVNEVLLDLMHANAFWFFPCWFGSILICCFPSFFLFFSSFPSSPDVSSRFLLLHHLSFSPCFLIFPHSFLLLFVSLPLSCLSALYLLKLWPVYVPIPLFISCPLLPSCPSFPSPLLSLSPRGHARRG